MSFAHYIPLLSLLCCLSPLLSCARCISAAIVIGGVFFYSFGSRGLDSHHHHRPSQYKLSPLNARDSRSAAKVSTISM